eukprot:179813-Prymnesium_polylepis.1
MLSPEAVSGHYARPAVPLARGCVCVCDTHTHRNHSRISGLWMRRVAQWRYRALRAPRGAVARISTQHKK